MKNPSIPVVAVLAMFLITALAGLVMRSVSWVDISPVAYLDLKNAHSHIAFLGWVFPAVMILLERMHETEAKTTAIDGVVFWTVIVVNILMFLSFLRYGYGPPSVIILSVHTILAVIYGIRFWNRLDNRPKAENRWLTKWAMVTMMLSFLGPLAIPIVKNTGLGPTEMKMAIHFYLHFQYNAFFVLAVLSFLSKGIQNIPKKPLYLLTAGMVGTYLLTVQFGVSDLLITVGVVFAILQAIGGLWLVFFFLRSQNSGTAFSLFDKLVIYIISGSIIIKIMMQLLLPGIPELVVESGIHMWVIAFLHLIFLGAVTPAIILYMMRQKLISDSLTIKAALGGLLVGFFITETTLFFQGSAGMFPSLPAMPYIELLVVGAGLMVLAAAVFLLDSLRLIKR